MATLSAKYPTLLDVAKRMDPNGKAAKIAELLSLDNEVADDVPMIEGNLPTGHRTTVRTGLPSVAWRKLNQGVAESKSTTAQIDEATAMLEGWGRVDKDLAELNGNTAEFRMSENMPFLEAMRQEFNTNLFYGDNITAPEKFLGLSPRFDDVPTTSGGAANKVNVIDAGGTGTDNSSIWLIGWGENSIHGIYPKGSKAGLDHEDLGLETVLDANGNPYRAYRDRYQWKCGIAVRDWRYVVRIANIDNSDLTNTAASGANIISLMTTAVEQIHSTEGVNARFYMPRRVRAFLRQQMVTMVKQSTLTMGEVAGKKVMTFDDIPVRRVDALLSTEARVV